MQAQVLNLMKDLQAAHGMAYLFISHDLAVVRYLCDDIVVLFRGAVVESGKTAQVLQAPAHPYTQELVDAMPRLGVRRTAAIAVAQQAGRMPPMPGLLRQGARTARAAPRAAAICETAPALRVVGDGRQAACTSPRYIETEQYKGHADARIRRLQPPIRPCGRQAYRRCDAGRHHLVSGRVPARPQGPGAGGHMAGRRGGRTPYNKDRASIRSPAAISPSVAMSSSCRTCAGAGLPGAEPPGRAKFGPAAVRTIRPLTSRFIHRLPGISPAANQEIDKWPPDCKIRRSQCAGSGVAATVAVDQTSARIAGYFHLAGRVGNGCRF